MPTHRTPVNPVTWSSALGFDQGTVITSPSRILFCSGQTATDSEGSPQHEGDMAGQLAVALDNLTGVLDAAQMSLTDLVRLTVYTTDVDLLLQHYGVLAARLGEAGATPPTSLLGVTRLAIPGQLVELEGTAAA